MQIRDKQLDFPLIQGGMGVGVSLGGLAGAVMKEGCMGVISAAHPGYRKENFEKRSVSANEEAIMEESEKARQISGKKGLLAVNVMCASRNYVDYVKASIRAGVDAIISGAGMPLDLPALSDGKTLLAPIVSSGKAAKLICKMWDKRYNCIPDFIVAESGDAGGHLGFSMEDLKNNLYESLETMIQNIRKEIREFEEKYQYHIPVFAAGGVFDGKDMVECIKHGADGVQVGTRFIATYECDADDRFKERIINARKEDIGLIKSPAGLPGRALLNEFARKVSGEGNKKISQCIGCLSTCKPDDTPYCISKALIAAVRGETENGIVFTGANGYKVDRLMSVKELIDSFKQECKKAGIVGI